MLQVVGELLVFSVMLALDKAKIYGQRSSAQTSFDQRGFKLARYKSVFQDGLWK